MHGELRRCRTHSALIDPRVTDLASPRPETRSPFPKLILPVLRGPSYLRPSLADPLAQPIFSDPLAFVHVGQAGFAELLKAVSPRASLSAPLLPFFSLLTPFLHSSHCTHLRPSSPPSFADRAGQQVDQVRVL